MKRRVIFVCAIIFAILVVILGVKLVFVGKSLLYTPERNEAEPISDAEILAYLRTTNFSNIYSDGKMFISFQRLGENLSQSSMTAYVWAVFQEYHLKNGELKKGSGYSLPLALYFQKSQPVALNAPRDGNQYAQDLKKIFPASIEQLPIFTDTVAHNEIILGLQSHNREDAEKYFASRIQPAETSTTTPKTEQLLSQ